MYRKQSVKISHHFTVVINEKTEKNAFGFCLHSILMWKMDLRNDPFQIHFMFAEKYDAMSDGNIYHDV